MALFRMVSPSFWDDTKVVDVFTPEDRYFMLYLLTNPHTNLLGCYEISVKQMSNETGYNRDSIYSLIKRFSEQYGILDYSEQEKEMLVKNWYKYNWSKSPKTKAALDKLLPNIKTVKFRMYLEKTVAVKFGAVEGGVPRPGITRAYGMYANVFLTDDEYSKFKDAYPFDVEAKIDRLSEYMKTHGKNYENHYAVLVAWAREDENKALTQPSGTSFSTDAFFDTALSRSYK